jgi:TPR repeat protein
MLRCFSPFLPGILALSLTSVATARADLEAGKRAWDQGDYATALKELTPLAEQGNADAQVLLGLMYFRGQGVSKDPSLALKWYKAAADQGNADGQAHLGSMYLMGMGVKRNASQALKLWKLSANQGNLGAQVNLGLAYRNLRDVPHDFVQSYMWFDLAAQRRPARCQTTRRPAEIDVPRPDRESPSTRTAVAADEHSEATQERGN